MTKRSTKGTSSQPAPEPAPAAAAAAGREPDFVWGGRPVFQCRLGCGEGYQRIDDLAAVLEHERDQHPTVERESTILDAGGKPFQVEET